MKALRLLLVLLSLVVCTGQQDWEWERVPSAPSAPARTAPTTPPVALARTPAAAPLSSQQLDQMVAPIALYPDPVLAQILMAATYPLEVVEANRWLQAPANAALKGDDLAEALQAQPWDPSVKSLVPFPQILKILGDNLEWTEQVGDAFLAQQGEVMDAVQRLRASAKAAGTFAPSEQQWVTTADNVIVVEPANPALIYVPCYSPTVVYGVWPWPAYPPYCWRCGGWPWVGVPIVAPLWGWWYWHWPHHRLYIDAARFNALNIYARPVTSEVWRHDPYHRHGVPYRDAATRAHFHGAIPPPAALGSRGYPVTVPPHGVPHAPPMFESLGHGAAAVHAEAARGAQSMGARPASPGFHAGGHGGFHGGGGHR